MYANYQHSQYVKSPTSAQKSHNQKPMFSMHVMQNVHRNKSLYSQDSSPTHSFRNSTSRSKTPPRASPPKAQYNQKIDDKKVPITELNKRFYYNYLENLKMKSQRSPKQMPSSMSHSYIGSRESSGVSSPSRSQKTFEKLSSSPLNIQEFSISEGTAHTSECKSPKLESKRSGMDNREFSSASCLNGKDERNISFAKFEKYKELKENETQLLKKKIKESQTICEGFKKNIEQCFHKIEDNRKVIRSMVSMMVEILEKTLVLKRKENRTNKEDFLVDSLDLHNTIQGLVVARLKFIIQDEGDIESKEEKEKIKGLIKASSHIDVHKRSPMYSRSHNQSMQHLLPNESKNPSKNASKVTELHLFTTKPQRLDFESIQVAHNENISNNVGYVPLHKRVYMQQQNDSNSKSQGQFKPILNFPSKDLDEDKTLDLLNEELDSLSQVAGLLPDKPSAREHKETAKFGTDHGKDLEILAEGLVTPVFEKSMETEDPFVNHNPCEDVLMESSKQSAISGHVDEDTVDFNKVIKIESLVRGEATDFGPNLQYQEKIEESTDTHVEDDFKNFLNKIQKDRSREYCQIMERILSRRSSKKTEETAVQSIENVSAQPIEQTKAVALYNFIPQMDKDLGLAKGDMVIVETIQDKNNWWFGTNQRTGLKGWFPKNYVQV